MLSARPGIPLLYLNKVTLVLEPPSGQSQEFNKEVRATQPSTIAVSLSRLFLTYQVEIAKVSLSAEEQQVVQRVQ